MRRRAISRERHLPPDHFSRDPAVSADHLEAGSQGFPYTANILGALAPATVDHVRAPSCYEASLLRRGRCHRGLLGDLEPINPARLQIRYWHGEEQQLCVGQHFFTI